MERKNEYVNALIAERNQARLDCAVAESNHMNTLERFLEAQERICELQAENISLRAERDAALRDRASIVGYLREPARKAFIPMQTQLARSDALNEYIRHVGSAMFAVPPGVRSADDYIGSGLFA